MEPLLANELTSTNGTPGEHEVGPDGPQVGQEPTMPLVGTDPSLGLEQAPSLQPHIALEVGSQNIEPETAPEPIQTQGSDPIIAPVTPPEIVPPQVIQTQGPDPTIAPVTPPEIVPQVIQTQGPNPTIAPTPPPEIVPQVIQTQAPDPTTAPPGQAVVGINHPFQVLFTGFDERRQDFVGICSALYKASMEGVWETAEYILQLPSQYDRPLVQCGITDNRDTVLHIAASSSQSTDFVRNLVLVMQDTDLVYQNENGNTALCLAAMTGNVEIARIMVARNSDLLTIRNRSNMTPLLIAALYGKRDMVNYLYDVADRESWTYADYIWVCLKCVQTDLFDIAIRIFPEIPDIEGARETQDILGLLARKPSAFEEPKPNLMSRMMGCFKGRTHSNTSEAMQLLNLILTRSGRWSQRVLHDRLRGPATLVTQTSQDGQSSTQIRTYPARVLFLAAEMGNINFLVELFRKYPDLIWKVNDNLQNIFHVAVSRRHESIYNLLDEIGSMKDLIVTQKDRDGNTLLHTVAKNAKNNGLQDVSGAAFQMQRRLLWYKKVESMIPPHYTEKRNNRGLTPSELFSETHNDLLIESEKWMKGTASKCMLVATLIATIVFGVAYTIPGGYDQRNGYPMFRHTPTFIVFVMFDAISLILSTTSILVFLSILTSRYAQEDFIESLPTKLMKGLTTLFFSIVTMMIAFSVSFFVLYHHKGYYTIGGSISLLALLSIVFYVVLHWSLLNDVLHSTYGSKSLFKPKKQMLYYKSPSV